MYYRQVGRTGMQVSPLCLGSTLFGEKTPAEETSIQTCGSLVLFELADGKPLLMDRSQLSGITDSKKSWFTLDQMGVC